jgi:multiple antibiotic resistance protein
MANNIQIFALLFLMLGPFKVIGPFASITKNATPAFARKLAIRATLFSTIALLLAAVLGENILKRYGIPIPILALSGGIILFLVALLNVIKQFSPHNTIEEPTTPPTLQMAMNPLAFPTIVTPYGIAALIVFVGISPDLPSKLNVGGVVLGIMALNLAAMLISRYIFKPLALVLALLGTILAVIQVALGLMIIYNQTKEILKL